MTERQIHRPNAGHRPFLKRSRLGPVALALTALLMSACIVPPPMPPPEPPDTSTTSTTATTSTTTTSTTTVPTTTTTDPGTGPVQIRLTEEPTPVVSPPGDILTLEAFVDTLDGRDVSDQFIFQWSCSDSAGGQGCAAMTVASDHPNGNVVNIALIHTVSYTVTLSAQERADPMNSDTGEWEFTAQPPL